ncbi:MAG: NAD-dependent epimerase/dehydratase family protein [Akkermansia sp.]
MTDSATMVSRPVETIMTTVAGTRHVLEGARQTAARGCLFLSSMEVYGHPEREPVREEDMSGMRSDSVRNSYPISKLLSENLCCAYAHEYGVPTRTARLTLTFGPGIPPTDRRVFAQFARSVIRQEDIVLLTEGKTQRDYLYTADAVRALLAILLGGENGGIYNISNPDSYVSIRELAEQMRRLNPAVQVVVRPDAAAAAKYAAEVHIRLDNSRLNALHPFARTPLPTMLERLVTYLREPRLRKRFAVPPPRA